MANMPTSSSPARNPASVIFRLLVPSNSPAPAGQPSIEVGGRRWILTESADVPLGEGALEYTCLSYAWGSAKTAHPFDAAETMSARTLAVIETAIQIRCPAALWVDALCVPFDEPARSTCLSQMGAIYAQASQVVVVLSELCAVLLAQIRESGKVDTASLLTLEGDDWVSRVWTYQELVNNNKIFFVAEGRSDAWAEVEEFLRNVAYAIDEYKKAQGYDTFKFRSLNPRLDSLEDLIADWKMEDYPGRSAYQVMSGMEQRESAQPEDYFYAMVGAISASPADVAVLPSVHPAEYFMRICEAKGDYSFIYTAASRSKAPGKRWRPLAADRFQAIFAWHSYGEGQSGRVYSTHIQLDGMWRVMPGAITSTAKTFVRKWLQGGGTDRSTEDMPARILRRLRLAGFSGCGEYLETEHGYMFPHSPLTQRDGVFAAVATGVRMVHGSPGLLLKLNRSDIHECCDVGFFVGQVPKSGESVSAG